MSTAADPGTIAPPHTVTSADGTVIAYDATGSGPALVLVGGAFSERRFPLTLDLVEHLADSFTVYNYDRRGRGDSGDTSPYAIEREVEDLDAVIAAAGGSALVWGLSSGAALGIEAAARGSHISSLACYEPPYVVNADPLRTAIGLRGPIAALLAAGEKSKAVSLFMTKGMGMPGVIAFGMKLSPMWKRLTALANTIPYDLAVTSAAMKPGVGNTGTELDGSRWAAISCPVTVMAGTKSPEPLRTAAAWAASAVPGATLRWMPDQNHTFKPPVVAAALKEMFR